MVFRTLEDTPGKWEGAQYIGGIMSTAEACHYDCEDIMSTTGMFSTLEGYPDESSGAGMQLDGKRSEKINFWVGYYFIEINFWGNFLYPKWHTPVPPQIKSPSPPKVMQNMEIHR